MKKWRRNLSLSTVIVGLLAFAQTNANAGSCAPCDPCFDPCSLSGFEIGADFLWWKPCVDDLDYGAELSSNDNKFKYHSICPDWEPGVRVTLSMPDYCYGFGGRFSWTYLECDNTFSFVNTGDVLATPIHGFVADSGSIANNLSRAKGSFGAIYHEWDYLLFYDCSCSSCHELIPFFGVAGIILKQEFKVDYFDESLKFAKFKWESDFWGIGLRIGADYMYKFSNCFSFFAKSSGTILTGWNDNDYVSRSFPTSSSSTSFVYNKTGKDDDCCQIIPGCQIGAGLIYNTAFCSSDFSFKLGYEFVNWYNLPSQRNFSSAGTWTTSHGGSSNTRTFGFHGLMAGLAFSF